MATAVYQPSIDLEASTRGQDAVLCSGRLAVLENAVVAYSGGVDSTFLGQDATYDALGSHALGRHRRLAQLGPGRARRCRPVRCPDRHPSRVHSRPASWKTPDYRANDSSRCFHCKAELFDRLREFVGERGVQHMLYGPVVDDLGDFRPWHGRQPRPRRPRAAR